MEEKAFKRSELNRKCVRYGEPAAAAEEKLENFMKQVARNKKPVLAAFACFLPDRLSEKCELQCLNTERAAYPRLQSTERSPSVNIAVDKLFRLEEKNQLKVQFRRQTKVFSFSPR